MPTELMALIDAYAATSAVNGIRSQWAQMARGKVELALKQLPAPQMHTDAGDAELIQALGDLSFACFAGIGTQAPDAETFNRTFAVLEKHRALLATATGLPAHSVPDGWREQFAAEVYADLAAADNQDVPLEEYPARILKVLGDIVGPRHPVVIQWRNDAIKTALLSPTNTAATPRLQVSEARLGSDADRRTSTQGAGRRAVCAATGVRGF